VIKVKICGITNLKDALAAVEAGSDALGFVFCKLSPRYITPKRVGEIISRLPKNIIKIGIFVNARENSIKNIAKNCSLDILQFHGDESPEFCRRFKNYKIIKAFRVKGPLDLERIARYNVFAYLFDSFSQEKLGGTAKRFNWEFLDGVSEIKRPVFLSGGLNHKNVQAAIKAVQPRWVDVSSGVEVMPGKKDPRKIRAFIKAIHVVAPFMGQKKHRLKPDKSGNYDDRKTRFVPKFS